MKTGNENRLLLLIRDGRPMTLRQQLRLTVELSIPSIVAQISAIAMQYIDAAMVGRLGADAAASIGLVSTTTWLFWGTCSAAATGFSVQVAHHVGAARLGEARAVLRQAILSVAVFSLMLAGIGALISPHLPVWLGGTEEINGGASAYFLIFALSGQVLVYYLVIYANAFFSVLSLVFFTVKLLFEIDENIKPHIDEYQQRKSKRKYTHSQRKTLRFQYYAAGKSNQQTYAAKRSGYTQQRIFADFLDKVQYQICRQISYIHKRQYVKSKIRKVLPYFTRYRYYYRIKQYNPRHYQKISAYYGR